MNTLEVHTAKRATLALLAMILGGSVLACGGDDTVGTVSADATADAVRQDANLGDAGSDSAPDGPPSADTCTTKGGSCGADGRGVTVGDCRTNFGADGGPGYLSDLECVGESPGRTCCFSTCNGDRNFACCANGTTFVPGCIDGQVKCAPGTQKQALGTCLTDAGID